MRRVTADTMQTVSLVFAVTAAIAASLLICLQGLKEIIGHHRWLSAIKFILCLLVLFGGPVAAADATFWSFIVGGVLVCAAVGLLCFRVGCKRRQRKWVGERLSNLRPGVTVWDATMNFDQALSIALERYPGVGTEFANELPIPLLRRVFETRLAECQQLSFEDFKTECLCDMSFYDMSGFAQNSALFIFVEPTQLEECQRWFVKNTSLWKECMAAKGNELIRPIRHIWKNNALNEAIRSNFTLYALGHMDVDSQKALCKALFAENPAGQWIHDNLPKPSTAASETSCKDVEASVPPNAVGGSLSKAAEPHVSEGKEKVPQIVVESPEAVSLNNWHSMSTYAECRFCRYRPPGMKLFSQFISKTMKYVYPWFRFCDSCEYKTLKFGLAKDEAAREDVATHKNKEDRRRTNPK